MALPLPPPKKNKFALPASHDVVHLLHLWVASICVLSQPPLLPPEPKQQTHTQLYKRTHTHIVWMHFMEQHIAPRSHNTSHRLLEHCQKSSSAGRRCPILLMTFTCTCCHLAQTHSQTVGGVETPVCERVSVAHARTLVTLFAVTR